jgi:hypothetical protein
MQSIARPFVGIALFVGVLAPFVVPNTRVPARTPAPSPADTDPVVEIWGEAMLSYKPATATPVQDVWPQAVQRGVQLDGMMRSGPHQEMVIAANPFEDAWRAPSIGGIRLDTGTFAVADVDIALPAEGFSWIVGRDHNARQQDATPSYRTSNSYQGRNWFQTSQPEIRFYDDATNTSDMVYLVYGADRYAEYKRVASTGTTFKGTNGAAATSSPSSASTRTPGRRRGSCGPSSIPTGTRPTSATRRPPRPPSRLATTARAGSSTPTTPPTGATRTPTPRSTA